LNLRQYSEAPLMVGINVSVIVDVAGLENINANMLNKVSYGNPVVYTASPVKTNGWAVQVDPMLTPG